MTVQSIGVAARTLRTLVLRALGWATLIALAAGPARAGSDERLGTSGALELLIPVGARGSALGPGVTSDIRGAEATFWNPAGLAGTEATEALFSHTQYFGGMKVNYAAVAVPAGHVGVFGFSAKVLSIGDVIVTTEQAPDGTGEILDPNFTVLGASWGRSFTDRLNFGATVNYLNEHVQSMNAAGLAVDFGVQYKTDWRGLSLAMTMKNLGPSMSFDGDNLDVSILPPGAEPGASNRIVRFTTASFEMPSYFTLGATYDLYRRNADVLQIKSAFQNNNFSGDAFCGAAEWTYRDVVALRGSWFGTMSNATDPITGDETSSFHSGDDLYRGYAFGGGFHINTADTRIGVDFAWRPVRQFFDDVYEIGLHVTF